MTRVSVLSANPAGSSPKALRSGRWTVGVLAGSVLDEYQNTVLFGANDELREQGATVVLFAGGVLDSPDASSAQRNAIYDLVSPGRIDGLIVLVSLGNSVGPLALAKYCTRFAPAPLCTLSVALPETPSVVVDDAAGMRELILHLLLVHGKRRVAFIRGPVGNEEAERRFRVYREVLARQGIAFDPELVAVGDFNPPSGAEAVRTFCDERRVSFDALIAANDYMALAASEALQARGVDVPGQVGVAGFDDIEEARFATPPLTTVRQPLYESGRQAGRVLAAMLRGEPYPDRVVLETSLHLRESCGCSADQTVLSEPPADIVTVESLANSLEARRTEIVSSLLQSVAAEHARIPPDWCDPLFEGLLADLRHQGSVGGAFVAQLDATLRRVVSVGGSIRPWHAVLSALSSATTRTSGDPLALRRADEILHRARVLVGDVRERVQAQHRMRRERWIRTLHETSEALMTAFGEDALVDAVAAQLPRLQIPACALSLYEGSESAATSRPLFVYDDNRRLDVKAMPKAFPSNELAPPGWLDSRQRTVIAQPLAFHGEQMGFALFEVGPREGALYEGLRELVSSALKGARLVQQVVHEATQRQRAERDRLEKEIEIAARIQTTIVPKAISVPGLDISATMIPATQVGGDYYDVVSVDGRCWIGIGDVAGHGLQAGLVMLMLQSVVAALVRRSPKAPPADVFNVLNAVMYDNVHRRMNQDDHATLSLMRYDGAGLFVFAGAHEDIVVHRAAQGLCERIETRGPWAGAFPDVSAMLVEASLLLGPADLMVLYTDGVTEAKDVRGVQFGLDRVCTIVERVADQPASAVRDHLIAAVKSWTETQDDDMSVVVVRRTA